MTYGYPTTLPRRSTGDVVARATGGLAYLRSLDWVLLLTALLLSGIGAVLVWSATREKQISMGNDPETYLKRHLLNLVIGLVLGFFASRLRYSMLRAYTPILYVLSLLGLAFVLTRPAVYGAKAWINLPAGFSVQPSEFAKIAIILGMAMILAEKRDGEDEPRGVDVVQALGIAAVPMALIMLEPDLGTVLVTACAVLGIIAVSGAQTRWLVGIIGSALAVGLVAVQAGLIKDYQVGRISSFLDPSADPASTGYNTVQARVAIGSGGVWGQGLFHGTQTQGGFVPKNSTDFVYSVAGEELGMVGAGAVVLLIAVIIWRGIRIALRASDMFGRLVATGIVCWLAFQAFENIGMNLGIMPVTGVPLPFVSYGGTSMFACWIAVGLLQNVHMRSQD